jgi:hypothetical protein
MIKFCDKYFNEILFVIIMIQIADIIYLISETFKIN